VSTISAVAGYGDWQEGFGSWLTVREYRLTWSRTDFDVLDT
jgi:hypothetical protein